MKCSECNSTMKVTHSYAVRGYRIQSGQCTNCRRKRTIVNISVDMGDATEAKNGAYAVASKIENGALDIDELVEIAKSKEA